MSELSLYPGTPVEIERVGQARYTEEKLLGRIESVDAAQLKILLPAALLHLLPLEVGEDVQLKALLPEGMYRFSGKILEKSARGFTLPYPFTIMRLQRREQRRVPAEGIVVFAIRDTTNARPNFGTLVDISIGGLQILSEKWLPIGASVDLEYNLHAGLRGGVIGLVRWKKDAKVNSAEVRTFCYGIKFVRIEEQLKLQIATYIRDYERSMLGPMAEPGLPVSAR